MHDPAEHRLHVPAIVATGERIAHGELEQLALQILAVGNVHQNAVIEHLAARVVDHLISRVEHCADDAVRPPDFQLELPHRTFQSQNAHFFLAPVEAIEHQHGGTR